MLHLLCEPKIEFKNLAGGKALANDHRKIAEYIFLPVGGYFFIYFICSPTGNPPGPASELLYKQNSTKMNRTIVCFMSAWLPVTPLSKYMTNLYPEKRKIICRYSSPAQLVIWLKLTEFSTLLSPSWNY